jgi:hypothetical protein
MIGLEVLGQRRCGSPHPADQGASRDVTLLCVVIPEGAGPVKSWLCCCVGRCLAVVRDGLGAPGEASVSRVGREADRVAAEGPGRWRRAVHAVWADRR